VKNDTHSLAGLPQPIHEGVKVLNQVGLYHILFSFVFYCSFAFSTLTLLFCCQAGYPASRTSILKISCECFGTTCEFSWAWNSGVKLLCPPLILGDIKRCFYLTSVCLSVAYIRPKSRTERPRKTKLGTEIAHVTRDSDTTFKVKGQGHQAAVLSVSLTHKAAAAVSVGTYSPRESTATLCLLGVAWGAWVPMGEERGGGILCRHTHSLLSCVCFSHVCFFGFTCVHPCSAVNMINMMDFLVLLLVPSPPLLVSIFV